MGRLTHTVLFPCFGAVAPFALKLFALVALLQSGCCVLEQHRIEDSGFLPYSEELARPDRHLPFDRVYVPDWERLDALRASRKRMVILPVDTRIVEEQAKKMDLPPSWVKERIADYRSLGVDLREKLLAALDDPDLDVSEVRNGQPRAKYEIGNFPDESSLYWEIAIVDVSPNIPVISVLATIANYFLHGTAVVRALGAGGITIEGVLRDGESGEPLLTFRDRTSDKIALFSFRNYTVYGHSRRALTEWAHQLAEISYAASSYEVAGSWIFTFNPF